MSLCSPMPEATAYPSQACRLHLEAGKSMTAGAARGAQCHEGRGGQPAGGDSGGRGRTGPACLLPSPPLRPARQVPCRAALDAVSLPSQTQAVHLDGTPWTGPACCLILRFDLPGRCPKLQLAAFEQDSQGSIAEAFWVAVLMQDSLVADLTSWLVARILCKPAQSSASLCACLCVPAAGLPSCLFWQAENSDAAARAKAFIQSRGRARARQASMVLMVEQGNKAELDLIKDCRRCAGLTLACNCNDAADGHCLGPKQRCLGR